MVGHSEPHLPSLMDICTGELVDALAAEVVNAGVLVDARAGVFGLK